MKTREEVRRALTGPNGSIRTPFLRDGSIDFKALRTIVDRHLAMGNTTILLTAGDSHYYALSDQEIAEVTKVVAAHTAGRAMVVAADLHYNTGRAVEFAKYARGVGADVLMAMPPDWGHSVTPATLVEHYAAVAAQIPVMVVTNVFAPRGAAFGLETLKLLVAQVPGIMAVKDDFCGEFGRKMAALVHEHWAVFSGGLKENHLDIHPYGCDGYLSSLIAFAPHIVREYWAAIQAGDILKAAALIRRYEFPWIKFIGALPGGFDAGMHGMLELYGLAERWRRKPYYSLNDAEMEQLRGTLQGLKLL